MTQSLYNQLIKSSNGIESALVRDILLPEILGDEADGILYWAGKDLARKFPVSSEDEIITLFKQFGFGELQLEKKNNKQQVWKLTGPTVIERGRQEHASFNLEAGMLAQEIEFQSDLVTEASVEVEKKKSVQIIVHYDLGNEVNAINPVEFIELSD